MLKRILVVLATLLVAAAGFLFAADTASKKTEPPAKAPVHKITRFEVSGLTSQEQANELQKAIKALDGVAHAAVSLVRHEVAVKYDADKTDMASLEKFLDDHDLSVASSKTEDAKEPKEPAKSPK